ncbi:hypothetical protein EON64_18320, partial [archaeon]
MQLAFSLLALCLLCLWAADTLPLCDEDLQLQVFRRSLPEGLGPVTLRLTVLKRSGDIFHATVLDREGQGVCAGSLDGGGKGLQCELPEGLLVMGD